MADKIAQIQSKKPAAVVRQALADYKDSKLTSEEIAGLHGVSTATLTVWAKKAGLRLRTRGRRTMMTPTARHLKILELAGHLRYAQIAHIFGMHKQQVHQIVKRWRNWKRPLGAPFKPGDIIAWKGKRLTVLEAGQTEGTLRDEEGGIYRHFTWAGPVALKKIGVSRAVSS